MDEATWAALAAALTVLGIVWTVVAWRRRGPANGLRALGLTLLPAAAWLTGTLEMFSEIAGSVLRWASGLVLDPFVWAGLGLAGLSVLLLVVSGILRDRQLARARGRHALRPSAAPAGAAPAARPATPGRGTGGTGELDEVEEILRRRGIS